MSEILQRIIGAAINAGRTISERDVIGLLGVSHVVANPADTCDENRHEESHSRSEPTNINHINQVNPHNTSKCNRTVRENEHNMEMIQGPTYPRGPSQIVNVRIDDGHLCRAAVVSEQMIQAFDSMAEAAAKRQASRLALEELTEREWKLRDEEDHLKLVVASHQSQHLNRNSSDELTRITDKLETIEEVKEALSTNIESFKIRVKSDQATICEVLHQALVSTHCIEDRKVASPNEVLAEYLEEDVYEDEPTSTPEILQQEAEMSAEEKAEEDALYNFQKAELAMQIAQDEFDAKDLDNAEMIESYENDVEAGTATKTRTELDHDVLQHNAQLTRNLIQAEQECNMRFRQLCAVPSEALYESPEPMRSGELALIEDWSMTVDSFQSPNFMPQFVDIQDWDFQPTEFNESRTTIEGKLFEEEIASWHQMCENTRKLFPQLADPTWTSDSKPLKRRRSCAY